MENSNIKWLEQEKYYGLDYSSARGQIGDYVFDIRYDSCGKLTKDGIVNTEKPDCGLVLTIKYKGNGAITKFGTTLSALKEFSESWFKDEVINYYEQYCLIFHTDINKKLKK